MDVKEKQLENTPSLKLVTFGGMVAEVNDVHAKNVEFPMDRMLSGKLTDVIVEQYANTRSSMATTGNPPMAFGTSTWASEP